MSTAQAARSQGQVPAIPARIRLRVVRGTAAHGRHASARPPVTFQPTPRPWAPRRRARRYARAAVFVTEIALIAAAFFLGVRLVRDLARINGREPISITPLPPPAPVPLRARSVKDFAVIMERDIFNPPKPAEKAPEPAAAPPLKARLLGTSLSTSGASFAVIDDLGAADESSRQALFREGDRLQGRTIEKIDRDEIVVAAPGERRFVLKVPIARSDLPGLLAIPSAGAAPSTPLDPFIAAASASASTEAEPSFEGGSFRGLRLLNVASASVLGGLGARSGDVVKRVDGKSLLDPLPALALLRGLKAGKGATVDVVRKGRQLSLPRDRDTFETDRVQALRTVIEGRPGTPLDAGSREPL